MLYFFRSQKHRAQRMYFLLCAQHVSYFLPTDYSADFLTLSDLLLFLVLLISYTLVTQVNPSANNGKISTIAFPPSSVGKCLQEQKNFQRIAPFVAMICMVFFQYTFYMRYPSAWLVSSGEP